MLNSYQITTGTTVKNITLPAIDGTNFNLDHLKGKPFMISFFRFATCPFCNLRIHQLTQRYDELADDFTIVAIFESPIKKLTKHAGKHKSPFPILADKNKTFYKKYGIQKSFSGMLKGMVFRFPTLMKSIFMGNIPLEISGRYLLMPASFLIDANGIVQVAYYGRDEGDHLPFDTIRDFSHKNSRNN